MPLRLLVLEERLLPLSDDGVGEKMGRAGGESPRALRRMVF